MQSKLWIKREVATYPNSELLKSLIYILPKIDSYKESLKLQEYYLANINIELFLIELNKEQVINENIDSYILRKIQEFASIKENLLDFKNSLMSKFFNSKITSGLKSGLLTLLAVCAFYTSSSYALSESNIDSKKKRGSGF
ncbi:MAG: hypothetical protein KatS3mg002_0828 [Candidatus Woesearchaeota archaeon]|nr:MAG: hypothetical protein KatS3mg002_0828 [Candidatus Woesearchaeota archaeon]